MLSSLMGSLTCALMVSGEALKVEKVNALPQMSPMPIATVASKPCIFIPLSITRVVEQENYFATSRLWLK